MAVDKSAFIKIIKEEFPGISDEGIKAIMGNVSLETAKGTQMREINYSMAGDNGIFSTKGSGSSKKYKHPIKTARYHMVKAGYASGELVGPDSKGKYEVKIGTFKQTAKQKSDYNALDSHEKNSLFYNGNITGVGGGFGPLQLTVGTGAAVGGSRNKDIEKYMEANGIEGTLEDFMKKLADDPEYGLKHTLAFYKYTDPNDWNSENLSSSDTTSLSRVINPGRPVSDIKVQIQEGNTWASDSIATYNAIDITIEENKKYAPQITSGPGELTQAEKDQIAIDIQPTPAPLPEDVPNVFSQIEVDKENARRRQEEEKKKKEEVYQPKELVPLSDLTEEEINNLTDEERKEYGLQPTVDVVGGKKTDDELTSEQIAQIEKERLLAEKEEAEENKYSQEQLQKEKENEEKKRKQKKAENKVIDKDGDGIPDTIDADAGEPVPENQLTVSTEEQVVIEEQEKEEAIETVETEEIEVLDANGNIKKITVPTVSTPTTTETEAVETETVKKPKDVVEKKPELIKPRLRDFKTSGDYVRARMKYFKSIEEQGSENTLDFDNELDDDEIKEAVDMEQNSTVIDASKRNIFKTNGKSNVFNSILGVFDDIAKGIQQELNDITKSINNKQ